MKVKLFKVFIVLQITWQVYTRVGYLWVMYSCVYPRLPFKHLTCLDDTYLNTISRVPFVSLIQICKRCTKTHTFIVDGANMNVYYQRVGPFLLYLPFLHFCFTHTKKWMALQCLVHTNKKPETKPFFSVMNLKNKTLYHYLQR